MSTVLQVIEQPKLLPFGEKAYNIGFRNPQLDRRMTLLEGSVRSAKTWALHMKIIRLCDYQVRGWRVLFGVTKSTIYQNVLNDLFEIIGPDSYHYNRQSGELTLFDSQWLVIGAKDEGSEKYVRGLTIGAAVGDELTLIPASFVKTILNRMSVEGARIYASTNPDTPFHYVNTDWIHNQALKDKKILEHIHFELADNPNLPEWYIEHLNSIYPPGSLYHQRFVLGMWVTGEGAIYKDVWSDEVLYDDEPWTMANGKPGCVAPKGLRSPEYYAERVCPVDCGVDHVQVYLDVIDDGNVAWVDNEYWWDSRVTNRQKTDGQYRQDLEKFIKPGQQVILPPECASFDAELTQHGIWHIDADNEVLDGIKMVAGMLAIRTLRFHRKRTKNTQMQMQTYMWDAKAALRGVEQPLKQKDDGPDCVRYFVKTKIAAWRLAHAGMVAA